MKTIICATDFSKLATNAANYAADMAAALNMQLCLFHVYSFPVTAFDVPVPPSEFDASLAEARRLIAAQKTDLEHRTNGKVVIDTEVRQGYFISDLRDYCEQVRPYAVVVGAEDAGVFERLLLGAAALGVIEQLVCPVIIVPRGAVFSRVRKIALACDIQDMAGAVPDKAILQLVKDFGAELHILHVSPGQSFPAEAVGLSRDLQEKLASLRPVYHFPEGTMLRKPFWP